MRYVRAAALSELLMSGADSQPENLSLRALFDWFDEARLPAS